MDSVVSAVSLSRHSATEGRSAWLKVRVRVLLPMLILTVLSSLDRVNISFAALQLNPTLGLSAEQYGIAVGIFFFAYLLFQFPSVWLQRCLGTRLWILCIGVSWGVIAAAMALIHTRTGLYVMRFLLGMAEAGLAPGIVYYCSSWLPRAYRAAAITTTMLAIPISVVIGGPLSGWLLSHPNPLHWSGWRWMMLVEGVPTIVMAALACWLIANRVEEASWLSDAERRWLGTQLRIESEQFARAADRVDTVRKLIATSGVWQVAAVWFALLLGSNGILFWLPLVLKQFSGRGELAVGIMSVVPWLGLGIGLLANAWHSDRTQERSWHVIGAMLLGAIGLASAAALGAQGLSLALLFVAGCGIGAAQGAFWAIPGNLWSGAVLGTAITTVNLLGNLASLVGPYLIGWVRSHTGSFAVPAYGLAACLVLGVWPLLSSRARINQGRSVG
jgi:ACS family tartrate transporter-like MFS transporter